MNIPVMLSQMSADAPNETRRKLTADRKIVSDIFNLFTSMHHYYIDTYDYYIDIYHYDIGKYKHVKTPVFV